MSFSSFGRREILGMLLPGLIPILTVAFCLYCTTALFGASILPLFKENFLASVVLLTVAYLIGAILRFYSTEKADLSSRKLLLRRYYQPRFLRSYVLKHLPERYRRGHLSVHDRSRGQPEYEGRYKNLSSGGDDPIEPEDYQGSYKNLTASYGARGGRCFEDWLRCFDVFPYVAWASWKWQAHQHNQLRSFFRDRHAARMWPDCKSPPIDFFNYCKLFVQQREPSLADEIHLTEAFTRFFAGTIASLMWSLWITIAFAAINGGILIVAAVSKLKINSVKWKSSVVTPRIVYVGAILLLGVLLIV